MFLKEGGEGVGKILQGNAAELRNAPQRFQKDQQNIKGGFDHLRVLGSPNPGQSFGRGLSSPQAMEVSLNGPARNLGGH